jgi:hypothetical protein
VNGVDVQSNQVSGIGADPLTTIIYPQPLRMVLVFEGVMDTFRQLETCGQRLRLEVYA